MILNQLYFGEQNHTNNLVNTSFYNAVQGYYNTEITQIELEYQKEQEKREQRTRERIKELQEQVEALSA